MTVLTEKTLEEILGYIDKSITKLAMSAVELSEFSLQELETFLSNQFDTRLENLLQSKDSSIHHLESGLKNKVIQRKTEVLDDIKNKLAI